MKYLYFSAGWCGPCRVLGPTMKRVESQGVPVNKVDVDSNPDLVTQYSVRSIPTVVLVDETGKEFARSTGVQPENFYLTQYASFNA